MKNTQYVSTFHIVLVTATLAFTGSGCNFLKKHAAADAAAAATDTTTGSDSNASGGADAPAKKNYIYFMCADGSRNINMCNFDESSGVIT